MRLGDLFYFFLSLFMAGAIIFATLDIFIPNPHGDRLSRQVLYYYILASLWVLATSVRVLG